MKISGFKRKLFTIIFALCFLSGLGQTPDPNTAQQSTIKKLMPNPIPQSPNVASLGKFGDYQVSHFNGIPEINIPIFEANSGSLSVPITLNYHASGIKPTDVASWVGMGWSLSAGGEISRQVQGKPDDQYYYANALNPNPSVCGAKGVGTFYYLQYLATGVNDGEPDIYSYSFPGQNGKFLLPYSKSPILFPYSPIVVKPIYLFNKFEITDEHGTLYRFGQNGNNSKTAYDYTKATNGGNPTVNAITALHLMEMVAPNTNDQITFDYQSLGSSPTHDVSYTYTIKDQCTVSNGGQCPNPYLTFQTINNDSEITQDGLKTITFRNGKVVFELGPARSDVPTTLKRLERIMVYSTLNGVDALTRIIQFNYSYFKNSKGGNQALKLDGVKVLDNTGNTVQNYYFSYFTNSFSWDPNTVNVLNARDLWGYYNGQTANTDLILKQQVPFQQTAVSPSGYLSIGGATNRDVNPIYIKEGVLKRIEFPTGGYSEFDFEPNKYSKNGVATNAGGLRVAKITSSDGTAAAPMVKIYKYGNGESGLGLANFSDNEFNYSSNNWYYSDCDARAPITNFQMRTFFSHSFGGESPIMYPYVTEYLGDPDNPSGTINGKTIFVYDNGSPAYDAVNTMQGCSKISKNSFSWKRGKLTSKTIYDSKNNIISSSTISRSLFKDSNNLVGYSVYQFITGNFSTCSGSVSQNEAGEFVNCQTYRFGSIYQSSGVLVETGVNEYTYINGDASKSITTSLAKTYNQDKLQVVSSTYSTSTVDEKLVTVNRYPFDFSSSNATSSGNAQGLYKLIQKNILSVPIETYTYKDSPIGKFIISGQVTTYRQNTTNVNYVVPDKVYLFESPSMVATTAYKPVQINSNNNGLELDSNFKPRVNFLSYDNAGNLLSLSKANDAVSTYFYGYNNSLPIAEVKNASELEVSVQNFEDLSISTSVVKDPLMARSGNQYYRGTYTVNFNRPNSRQYVIDYWHLDASNTWHYSTKPFQGNTMTLNEGSAVDDVRIYPQEAQISTYTHELLSGMTSITDRNGNGTYYKYDSFGRLKLIKDTNLNIIKIYDYNYKVNNAR